MIPSRINSDQLNDNKTGLQPESKPLEQPPLLKHQHVQNRIAVLKTLFQDLCSTGNKTYVQHPEPTYVFIILA